MIPCSEQITDPEAQGFTPKKGHVCLYFFGTHNFANLKEDPVAVKPFYDNLHLVTPLRDILSQSPVHPRSPAPLLSPPAQRRTVRPAPPTSPRRPAADQAVDQDVQERDAADGAQ